MSKALMSNEDVKGVSAFLRNTATKWPPAGAGGGNDVQQPFHLNAYYY